MYPSPVLQQLHFFFFFFGHATQLYTILGFGMLVPQQGIEPGPLAVRV